MLVHSPIYQQDLRQRGIRVNNDAQSLQPGEFRDVDAPGGNLRDAFMTLPYKEPSANIITVDGYLCSGWTEIRINC